MRHFLGIERFGGRQRKWRQWEIKLLGKQPDAEVAKRIGRAVGVVTKKRHFLHIPSFNPAVPRWTKKEECLLSQTLTDAEISRRTGRTQKGLAQKRRHLMPGVRMRGVEWKPEEIVLLGTMPDRALARKLGRSVRGVRRLLKIKGVPPVRLWTNEEISLLETMTDSALARKLNREREFVKSKRLAKKIPAYRQLHRWTKSEDEILLRLPPTEAARTLNQDLRSVESRLKQLRTGIPSEYSSRPWSAEETALLGTLSDRALARQLKPPLNSVAWKRAN